MFMSSPALSVKEKEIMVEMICDDNAPLADVDAELAKHGFPAMNAVSYDLVKEHYCPAFLKYPKKRHIHIYVKSLTIGQL